MKLHNTVDTNNGYQDVITDYNDYKLDDTNWDDLCQDNKEWWEDVLTKFHEIRIHELMNDVIRNDEVFTRVDLISDTSIDTLLDPELYIKKD